MAATSAAGVNTIVRRDASGNAVLNATGLSNTDGTDISITVGTGGTADGNINLTPGPSGGAIDASGQQMFLAHLSASGPLDLAIIDKRDSNRRLQLCWSSCTLQYSSRY